MPSHYNPDEFSQIHKTLSKSFVMQRKTLVRVLGLEGRVSELELQQAAEEQAKEGIDEILNDIHEAKEEVGGTKTKPKTKRKPKVKKTKVKGKRIRKPKIDADKFKRGTSQETVEERLKRQIKNRQETVEGEKHQETDEYKETASGTDAKGEYLSPEERKRRFKAAKFIPKTGLDPQDIKPETEAEIGDDSKKDNVIAFLNGDVKDNLDDVRDDLKQIEGLLKDQNKSADDQYEEMRQGILTAKKKKREEDLEDTDKDKKPGGGLKDKMLGMITKPAGSFFNKIIKFITMTFLGSVVNRILGILKDPAQLLDPIKQFFNAIVGMMNSVMKGLWMVTGAPINFIIGGINSGVKFIIDGINKVSGLLQLPEITSPELPLVPGPPEIPMIPLSKTAQAKNEEAVAMAGGGVVPEMSMGQQIMRQTEQTGTFGEAGSSISTFQATSEQRKASYAEMGIPSMELWDGSVVPNFGKMGAEKVSQGLQMTRDNMVENGAPSERIAKLDELMAMPEAKPTFIQNTINRLVPGSQAQVLGDMGDSITASAKMNGGGLVKNLNIRRQGFSGGGIVPGPYPTTNLLGMGHNVINTAPNNIMGYNKGGKVPGQGEGDTVPAMLTPGEFVMSKGAVDQIGSDKLMAMNAAGGGTNQPKLMKFAGGGMVPGIDAPSGRGRNVVVIGGGGKKSSSSVSSTGAGQEVPKFSSTDPNNMTIPVIKSVYNLIS